MPEVKTYPTKHTYQWVVWPSWKMWRWHLQYPEEAARLLGFREIEQREQREAALQTGPQGGKPSA